jgi:hypothetical protein
MQLIVVQPECFSKLPNQSQACQIKLHNLNRGIWRLPTNLISGSVALQGVSTREYNVCTLSRQLFYSLIA